MGAVAAHLGMSAALVGAGVGALLTTFMALLLPLADATGGFNALEQVAPHPR